MSGFGGHLEMFEGAFGRALADFAANRRAEVLGRIERAAESPIESMLLVALAVRFGAVDPLRFRAVHVADGGGDIERAGGDMAERRFVHCPGVEVVHVLAPQCSVGKYRADAVLLTSFEARVATGGKFDADLRICVECDGHDSHERTKQQAARDRARDRWFQSQGFVVLRFTGSEIVRDPWALADEAHSHVDAWAKKQRRASYPERLQEWLLADASYAGLLS